MVSKVSVSHGKESVLKAKNSYYSSQEAEREWGRVRRGER
jgi:hypothetical protein